MRTPYSWFASTRPLPDSVQITHVTHDSAVNSPPRELGAWQGDANVQSKSDFFSKLPAEIRNEIYEHVFTPSFPSFRSIEEEFRSQEQAEEEAENAARKMLEQQMQDSGSLTFAQWAEQEKKKRISRPQKREPKPKASHSLSLLLTCRRVNDEATYLAWSNHNFTICEPLPYHILRIRANALPPTLASTITSLSLLMDDGRGSLYSMATLADRNVCAFMTHAVLIFPTITRLNIISKMYSWNDYYYSRRALEHREPYNAFPTWFIHSISMMTGRGTVYPWQKGERWEAVFPPTYPEQPVKYTRGDLFPRDDSETANRTADDCSVLITQETTGRQVRIYCQFEVADDARRAAPVVRLIPDKKYKLPLTQIGRDGREGYMWDGDEQYWEGLRKNLDAGGWGWKPGSSESKKTFLPKWMSLGRS